MLFKTILTVVFRHTSRPVAHDRLVLLRSCALWYEAGLEK
jgi:hypothetical protein